MKPITFTKILALFTVLVLPVAIFAQTVVAPTPSQPVASGISVLFLQIVVPAVFTAIAAVVTWGGKKLIDYIDTKTKNEAVAGILARLAATVQTVVLEINGTVKAEWIKASADGVITDEEKRSLRNTAITVIKAHLGPKGLAELTSVLGIHGDLVDSFIGSHVEAAIEGSKVPPDGWSTVSGMLPDLIAATLSKSRPTPPVDPTVSSTGDAVPPQDPQ